MKPTYALLSLYLAFAACASAPAPMPEAKPKPKPERLAECLVRTGAHLYGASWCHYCHEQLALFGADAPKIPYTECDSDATLDVSPACKAKGFEFDGPYPTWILGDGRRILGIRSLSYLARQTGCPAP